MAEQAAQCGYCTSGMIVAATALLARTPRPTREQIQDGLAGNLCRCGTHTRIIDAVPGIGALRPAQGRPFDQAQGRPLDLARGRPDGLDYWRFSIVCVLPAGKLLFHRLHRIPQAAGKHADEQRRDKRERLGEAAATRRQGARIHLTSL